MANKFIPVRNRLELTRQLIQQLPPDQWTTESAMLTWWFNIRDTGGMRLSRTGYDVFVKELKIEYYSYTIPKTTTFTAAMMLALDRRLQDPYFVAREHGNVIIKLFGSKEAVLINLYGDLWKFLQSLS